MDCKIKNQPDIDITASGDCCKCNGLDLISRQDAIDHLKQWLEIDSYSGREIAVLKGILRAVLFDLETMLPAEPEIVRCKDCKHKVVNSLGWAVCEMESLDPYEHTRDVDNDNWFCADGERREDD